MKKLECEQIQKIGLSILEKFDEYTKKHDLTYYMAGGTLLGAVRHGGFIPWDDDVDVMMPRPDYERFIREFRDDKLKVSSCEYDPLYTTPFARLWDINTKLHFTDIENITIGVFIDIFPIDGYPTNYYLAKLHSCRLKYMKAKINSAIRLGYKSDEKYIFMKKILKMFWKKDGNYYANQLNAVGKKYAYGKSQYVGVTTTTEHIFRERNHKSVYKKEIYLPFEHLMLPAPIGYREYLEKLYGDYMELPPIEKRKTEHMFDVYTRDEEDN